MPATITLPDELASKLEAWANSLHQALDKLVIDIVADALEEEPDAFPTLEEVVAKIKATPPDPTSFHPATGSLAEALADSPLEPSFDEEEWHREWAKVEAEMKAMTRANDIAEGRG